MVENMFRVPEDIQNRLNINVSRSTRIDDEILEMALKRKNITKDNALFVVSNLLCEGIVDEMKIDPKQLVKFKQVLSNYEPEKNRPFSNALDKCTPEIVEFLVS